MSEPHKKAKIAELKPGIFQLRSERPGSHVYLIKGLNKNVLIDTGTASNYPNLTQGLAELGLKPSQIHLIILTHEHFDHIGACSNFFETAVVGAHPLAANKISLQDEFVMMAKYLDVTSQPFRADIWLHDNSVIDLGNYRIRVIHTPGHCSGCICLYEPTMKLLFTGDTVLAGGLLSGILGSGNISDYINSLQRLSSLHVDEFYPGHGRISLTPRQDLAKALEDSLTHMEECKALFGALDTKSTYEHYFAAISGQHPVRPVKEDKT
jgi:glyoxylase-like metal-dependent hydrolase (beta-lactamase superfamily II)